MCVDVVAGLGVAALPLSSYAVEGSSSDPVKVTAKIDETFSITTSADGSSVDLGTLGTGLSTKTATVTVKARTATKQYSLYVKDSDEFTGLYKDGNTSDSTNVIPAAKDGLTAGTTGWGVRVQGDATFKAVTKYSEAGTLLKSTGNAEYKEGPDSDEGDETIVEFGASYASDGSLATGDYEGAVVFIAVANS